MEFQAIVLAGGKGGGMSELTSNVHKCLLPIGNKPMLWYPVRMLEKAGFNGIFKVFCLLFLGVLSVVFFSFLILQRNKHYYLRID
jgi:NDP-sugar pyrophosphorylase family protein